MAKTVEITPRRYQSAGNYTRQSHNYEHYDEANEPSLTEPDLALSVQEIMTRFTQGRSLPEVKNLHFTQDLDVPDIRTLDLVERAEILEWAKTQVKVHQDEIDRKMKLRSQNRNHEKNKLKRLMDALENEEKNADKGGTTTKA